MSFIDSEPSRTVVLEVGSQCWASQYYAVSNALKRHPGVLNVEVNPVSQQATVTYNVNLTSVAELTKLIQACGFCCNGQSVPANSCDPLLEGAEEKTHDASKGQAGEATKDVSGALHDAGHPAPPEVHGEHRGETYLHHPMDAATRDGHDVSETLGTSDVTSRQGQRHGSGASAQSQSSHDAMGHGGHGNKAMQSMVTDMRNRFLVAVVFAIPILIWSPIGRDVLRIHFSVPFGLRSDVWQLILSLPVVFYSSWIFFDGALRALRARTLDMMVLVAAAVGSGWLYSVVVTATGGGEVFYEASAVLASFVLLGHFLEMRARGGANDAIRTLLNLSPPKAIVERNGTTVEIPTAEVVVGDILVVQPGAKIAVDGVVVDGESDVDEGMVTGESLPVHKTVDSPVIGATINSNGSLRVRTTKVGSDTVLAQIVAMVQEAQNSKAPGQKLADRAAFWLVFVALIGGLVTLAAWLLSWSLVPMRWGLRRLRRS
jgi:Cu2+-exporting ATPase